MNNDMGYRAAGPNDTLFKLTDFLVEPRKDYSKLSHAAVEGAAFFPMRSLQSPAGLVWVEAICSIGAFAAAKEEMCRSIKSGILLDLGGATGSMGQIAAAMGAAVYINVDMAPDGVSRYHNPSPTTNLIPDAEAYIGKTQRVTVQADMLDFLSRVPTGSCHVTINGIDSAIIRSMSYHWALAHEITRIVKPDGIVWGVGSDSISKLREISLYNRILDQEHTMSVLRSNKTHIHDYF